MNRSQVYKETGIFILWGMFLILAMNYFPSVSIKLDSIISESIAHKSILLIFGLLCFVVGIHLLWKGKGGEESKGKYFQYMVNPVAKILFSFSSAYIGILIAGILFGISKLSYSYTLPKLKVLLGLCLFVEMAFFILVKVQISSLLKSYQVRCFGFGLSFICFPMLFWLVLS
ncbi:hypothetical protein [Vibrio campbellii]|uniref:hypothetical protein n=1 Tax=Vibrio campbellii TaxID=680 RepID=UPI003857889B